MAIQMAATMTEIQIIRCVSTFSLSQIQALRIVIAEKAEKPMDAPTRPSPVDP